MKTFRGHSLEDFLQYPLNSLERLALDSDVMLLQNISKLIHDDGICAHRADIDAKIDFFHPIQPVTLLIKH
jgi:hypothetical protein